MDAGSGSRSRRRAVLVTLLTLALSIGMADVSQAGGVTVTDLNNGPTPTSLAEALVGGGVAVSNATLVGANRSAGTFSGGAGSIGFESAIVLGSGKV